MMLITAAIVVATAAFVGIASATTATCTYPQTLAGSAFEIDTNANLKVDATGPTNTGCIDWLTGANVSDPLRPGVIAQPDLPSGQNDNSFVQGSKEDTANPTVEFGSIPPNKSDLSWFGIYTEQNPPTPPDGNLELFWSRVQDPSGTTNMDFELNQKFCGPAPTFTNCAGNHVTPVRTVDDILITYDLSRGGTQATISIRRWDGSKWGQPDPLDNTEARGTINTTAISQSPLVTAQNPTGSLSPRTFGEAAVSFNALFGAGECGSFGSAYLKSRSSDSFTAALKDFVPPKRVDISNCPSALTTTATPNADADPTESVTLGDPISDTAHLNVPDGAGGTITFHLFSDDACANEVTTGLTPVAVDGPGDYNSGDFTPDTADTYYWTAEYSGDATTEGSETACGDANETSVVDKVQPGINTTLSAETVDVGTAVHDSAALTGATSNAGGTVTYTVYTNNTCTAGAQAAGTKTVANGIVPDSNAITFNTAGDFYWQAVYSGDDNNLGATSLCTSEHLVVNQTQTTISTTQRWLPNDTATITANGGGNLLGTVRFRLYDNATCSGTALYDSGNVAVSGTSPQNPSSANTTALTSSATVSWLVEYTSTNQAQTNATSACNTEHSTVTITNG
jgi:hypothetical protein